MRILIVKLSSLGDVVHAMAAVQDIRHAYPTAQIDWVVERNFAPLVRRCKGVRRVIGCELRRWRQDLFSATTRQAWQTFRAELQQDDYDAVLDLQGLAKSALVSWLARLTPKGKRFAMANPTEGSSYEAPTRWVADLAYALPVHSHAVTRARLLCAQVFGYSLPLHMTFGLLVKNKSSLCKFREEFRCCGGIAPCPFGGRLGWGLALDGKLLASRHQPPPRPSPSGGGSKSGSIFSGSSGLGQTDKALPAMKNIVIRTGLKGVVALVHGSSRADKQWPLAHWRELAQRLQQAGFGVALMHGNDAEQAVCQDMARDLAQAQVWPRLPLDALTDALAACAGVIGVDSGLSHIAVALDLRHVQIYNFDTAWRTGPLAELAAHTAGGAPRQCSVFARPTPTVDVVWQAWQAVLASGAGASV